MSFYDLPKEKREKLAAEIQQKILSDFSRGAVKYIQKTFSDNDTYIRKTAYIAVGRIYGAEKKLQKNILRILQGLLSAKDFRVRQTAINAAGEIGRTDFEKIEIIMEKGLFDEHHSPRNAVIWSLKKMGEKNPEPALKFAAMYIHHPDKEIRREICQGLELRGRTHPEEILPLLRELEFDSAARVKNTLTQREAITYIEKNI
jgi:HEAT repeat protein